MKKRKFLSWLLAVAMIATLMTACRKAEGTFEPTTETMETTEVTETVETTEAIENAETKETLETESTSETVPDEISEAEESVSTENTSSESMETKSSSSESMDAENLDLPGENRNGRYPDIPESVLPADKAANMDFFDEPVKATCWIDDVEGNIYADYDMTQLIKSVRYSVDGYNDVLYIIAEDGSDSNARGIATYNGQYVVINFNMWGAWYNGLDPNYN